MSVKTLKEWFTNFGTIFSILGFFATIYLGVWYVPAWIKESQNMRIKNAENEILQSVKELIYNDSTFTLKELPALVRAKEITINEKFPLSNSDILTKTEESFMEDKFLPLSKRKELIKKLEQIKQELPKEAITEKQKTEKKGITWDILLSIVGSIVTVILGIISSFIKFKSDKDKETEIQNEINVVSTERETIEYAYEFERNIEETLKKRKDIQLEENDINDRGIDFIFSKSGKRYFVEAKYLTRSKIGLNTYYKLAQYINNKSGEAWLIYNTDLTPMVLELIKEFNKNNKQISIRLVNVKNSKEFAEKLDEILPK